MNSKEKAKELLQKCDGYVCYALIVVDEMIKELDELLEGDERPSAGVYYLWEYYKEVKQEIELL